MKGPIHVWDVGKAKRLCEIKTTASIFAFSPSARLLLTAVVSPRLNVDNGLRIWSYDGRLLHTLPFDAAPNSALYQAFFLPAPAHHDPPVSPRLFAAPDPAAPAAAAAAPAAGVYQPPAARYRHPNASASAPVREEAPKCVPDRSMPVAPLTHPCQAGAEEVQAGAGKG